MFLYRTHSQIRTRKWCASSWAARVAHSDSVSAVAWGQSGWTTSTAQERKKCSPAADSMAGADTTAGITR